MGNTIDKIAEIEYNEEICLAVIERDEDLKKIFTDEIKISFPILYQLASCNTMNPDTSQFIRELFDFIILTKTNLVNDYLFLAKSRGVLINAPIVEKQEKPIVKEKKKKEKILPRRFGKDKIIKEIEKQNGKATPPQLAALDLNDLKNITIVLNTRLIKDMLTDDKTLSEVDYREIRSAVNIFKNKVKRILKKN